jgi:prephenate dehydrogenase
MKTLVVGAGAMGQWFAGALLASADRPVEVAFVDADPATAHTAASALDARTVSEDTDERFDLVCVAVPIPATAEAIATYAPLADAAVVDLAGVMAGPLAAMADHAPACERASLHPLFAPANAPGNVALVDDAVGPTIQAVRETLERRGNAVFETTAAEHDAAMETVQASAHTAVLAFALAAEAVPEQFQTPISATLFDLAEQVTDGDPRVYADIQDTFSGARAVAAAAERIAEADHDGFEALYREAAASLEASESPEDDP